ncbi:MAG: HEPN domain-containing protein [Synergistales bacterium]|nr:HEPN domain-containing protein [Synergistales bacterium]MBC7083771.1 HEPN domain-containing protein [Bacillota bacterium]
MDEETRQYVCSWFAKADEDLYAASQLMENPHHVPVTIVCFHCQQCAEKYLKGLLLLLNIEYRRSHDLVYLVSLLNDQSLVDALLDKANVLNDYAVEPRYPGAYAELPMSDGQEALEAARAVRALVLAMASEAGYKSSLFPE